MAIEPVISWEPPPRPDWVQRVNAEGRAMNLSGVVPLDAASLISSAIEDAQLSDFGEDSWREPFQILCTSLDADADLNLLGRIRTRSELLLLLDARLKIEAAYKANPEIENESISKPIFIVGQGRSGTSYLQHLLAADPRNGVTMTWEVTFPCPPPEKATYSTDARIEKAHALADQCNRVTPTLASMHEFSGRIPQDCSQILGLSFITEGWFNAMAQVEGYNRYLATADFEPAYRYHQRVLKLLQWKNPRKQWILKDPTHLERMLTILKIYPDACFVWPHRDPVKALASTVDLVGTLHWGRSDHPFRSSSFEAYVDPGMAAHRLNAVIDLIESGKLPKRRLLSILYRDLVAAPLQVIETIYRFFHLDFEEIARESVAAYIERNPRTARPAHPIRIEGRLKDARAVLQRYQEYFGVPNEIQNP